MPQIREKNTANLFILISKNSKLNSIFEITGNKYIQISNDSYDLDAVVKIL